MWNAFKVTSPIANAMDCTLSQDSKVRVLRPCEGNWVKVEMRGRSAGTIRSVLPSNKNDCMVNTSIKGASKWPRENAINRHPNLKPQNLLWYNQEACLEMLKATFFSII